MFLWKAWFVDLAPYLCVWQEMLDYDYVNPLKEAKEEYSVELEDLKASISNQEAVPVLYEAKKVNDIVGSWTGSDVLL